MQIAELGHGTFGMVVKALDIRTTPPTEVAIKMLPRGDFVSPHMLGICSRPPACATCLCRQLALIMALQHYSASTCINDTDLTLNKQSCLRYCCQVTVSSCPYTALQIKNYKTYVKREIHNQSSLRHPLIVSIREVSI